VRTFSGSPSGEGRRVAIVVSRFNEIVTSKLVDGAVAGLGEHGVAEDDVDVVWVPGAFEIPLVAQRLATTGGYDAVICLGALIRGETRHFDLVAQETARGIMDVGRETGIPVVFQVIAAEDLAQAEARSGGTHGNRGWDAAATALTMVGLLESLPGAQRTSQQKSQGAR
jgi:6,7-dimethyl-8-ribityllumazine synthase